MVKITQDILLENTIGKISKWHLILYMLTFLATITSALSTFYFSFTGFIPNDYRCLIPQCNETFDEAENLAYNAKYASYAIPYWNQNVMNDDRLSIDKRCYIHPPKTSQCSSSNDFDQTKMILCDHHIYDKTIYKKSLAMELDIPPCKNDQSWPLKNIFSKKTFMGLGFMIGLLIGSYLAGTSSDTIGRKKTVLFAVFGCGVSILAGSFTTNIYLYFAAQLLTGTASIGIYMTTYVMLIENLGSEYRTLLGVLTGVPFAIGEIILGSMAYFIQDWRTLQLVVGIVTLSMLILWFLLPESPRWLIYQGRIKEAKEILIKGAAINGKEISNYILDELNKSAPNFIDNNVDNGEKKLGFTSLFSRKRVGMNTVIMIINWISTTMSFYGLSMISVNLGGNTYVNFILAALVEIPSYIFLILVMDHIGRRTVLMFCQILSGASCIIAGYVTGNTLPVVFSLIGKFGTSASFSIVYLYTAEMYPTVIRNTAVGMASMFARFGGIAAPFLAGLKNISSSLPFLIMGIFSLIGGLLSIVLPETLGMSLPETLDEIENLSNNKKPWWKWLSKSQVERLREQNLQKSKPSQKKNSVFVIPEIRVQTATPRGSPKILPPIKEDVVVVDDDLEDNNSTSEVEISPESINQDILITNPNNTPSPEIQIQCDDELPPPPIEPENKSIEVSNEPTNMSLTTPVSEKSRRFSNIAPAPLDSPKAKKDGAFTIIPTIDEKPNAGPQLSLPEGASRKFSQLGPAPLDDPSAKKVGNFVMIPTLKRDME